MHLYTELCGTSWFVIIAMTLLNATCTLYIAVFIKSDRRYSEPDMSPVRLFYAEHPTSLYNNTMQNLLYLKAKCQPKSVALISLLYLVEHRG